MQWIGASQSIRIDAVETSSSETGLRAQGLNPLDQHDFRHACTGYVVSLWGTIGITLALREGFEINFFGSGLGIDPEELAIKLPSLGKLSLLDLFG